MSVSALSSNALTLHQVSAKIRARGSKEVAVRYETEVLVSKADDGTMPNNVAELAAEVVGHRIVKVQAADTGVYGSEGIALTLDDGRRVKILNFEDCCAHTDLKAFVFNADLIDHVITGVGTTGGYTTWHIYADMGDV
ncbi:MAG: DUF7448 domain-containing protein, partial [Aestuariivirga sp.]